MSTRIEDLVKAMEMEIHEKENQEVYEGMIEVDQKKQITVSSRFDPVTVAYMDLLAEKVDSSRSALLNDLASNALMDVIAQMGFTNEFFEKLTIPKK